MSGERMLVTGHRKGAICVWDLGAHRVAAPNAARAEGGGRASDDPADEPALIASLPPPDGRGRPTTSRLRPDEILEPLTASDEMIRGVAIVDTHGLAAAGPSLVYANRAGQLTKLCTIAPSELAAFGDAEWDRYAHDPAADEADPPLPQPADPRRQASDDSDQEGALLSGTADLFRGAPFA